MKPNPNSDSGLFSGRYHSAADNYFEKLSPYRGIVEAERDTEPP